MIEFFSELTVMRFLDGLACAFLACAATIRARNFGAHITGAIVLGCICGLFGPLLRETFLHGQNGSMFVAAQFPAEALIGAAAAIAGCWMLKKMSGFFFFWMDTASIGLAASIGALLALPETGITGALSLGMINALAPGLIRDISLGDTALLLEQKWYATAAALACLIAIAILIWLAVGWVNDWTATHAEESAVLIGTVSMLMLRGVLGEKEKF